MPAGKNTINIKPELVQANSTLLALGLGGKLSVHASVGEGTTVHFVLDVVGYFR